MADARTPTPRIRIPRIRSPFGSRRAATAKTTERTAPTKPAKATKETAKASGETKTVEEAPTPAVKSAATAKAPDPNLAERMEGLQGWMAEIERKQGRMSYFGAAAILIALAAAGAALYFGITSKSDSAPKDDLDTLEKKVDSLQKAVSQNNQQTQDMLNNTVQGLQTSIQELTKKQAQDAATISTLQKQIAAGAAKGAAATPAPAATPGATTTTKKP